MVAVVSNVEGEVALVAGDGAVDVVEDFGTNRGVTVNGAAVVGATVVGVVLVNERVLACGVRAVTGAGAQTGRTSVRAH